MKYTIKKATRALLLGGIFFTFLLGSGCSSNGTGAEILFSIIGDLRWERTENGTGDPSGEPISSDESGENNRREVKYREDGTYTITFDYGPEARYSRDGSWEITDDTLILDKGQEFEQRWNVTENGSTFTFLNTIQDGTSSFWTREVWTKQ